MKVAVQHLNDAFFATQAKPSKLKLVGLQLKNGWRYQVVAMDGQCVLDPVWQHGGLKGLSRGGTNDSSQAQPLPVHEFELHMDVVGGFQAAAAASSDRQGGDGCWRCLLGIEHGLSSFCQKALCQWWHWWIGLVILVLVSASWNGADGAIVTQGSGRRGRALALGAACKLKTGDAIVVSSSASTLSAATVLTLESTTGGLSSSVPLTLAASDGISILDALTVSSTSPLVINADSDGDGDGTLTVQTGKAITSGNAPLCRKK